MKRLLWVLAALALLAGAAVVALAMVDLRPFVAARIGAAFGREATIERLQIHWGRPIVLDMQGLRVANAPWGSQPDMLRIARLRGALNPWSLLRAVPELRDVQIDGAILLLERGPGRAGNWRRKDAAAHTPSPNVDRRAGFPDLLDMTMRESVLTYRTTSGAALVVRVGTLATATPDGDHPVTLMLDGAYGDTPLKLQGTTDPLTALRTASRPYGVRLKLDAAHADAALDGDIADPFDFEGVRGTLRVSAASLGDLMAIIAPPGFPSPPIQASGAFAHAGNAWQWTGLAGTLGADAFTGNLALEEAVGPGPDAVTTDLAFPRLDVKALGGAGGGSGAASDPRSLKLELDPNPGATVDATLSATALVYGGTSLADVAAHIQVLPGAVSLSGVSFGVAGGKVQGSAQAQTAPGGTRLQLNAALAGGDIGQLLRLLGAGGAPLSGRLEARSELDMTGETLGAALRAGQGQAVLALSQGRVARDVLEKLSTDLRNVLRAGEGSATLTCLLTVLQLRNGLATVAPLRLRTPEATVIGGGTVNVSTGRLNLLVQSVPRTTGLFALDIPIEITGTLDDPSPRPALGRDARGYDRLPTLPAALRDIAEQSRCK